MLAGHALHTAHDAPRRRDMLLPALVLIVAGTAWAGTSFAPQRFGLPDWTTQLSPLPGIVVALLGVGLFAFTRVDLVHRVRMLTAASPVLVLAVHVGIIRLLAPAHDLHPIGDHLRALQQSGAPIAHVDKYHGQFHFVGRLTRPIEVVALDEVPRWAENNPRGRVISYSDDAPAPGGKGNAAVASSTRWPPRGEPEFSQDYRRDRVFVWGPEALRAVDAAR
jgi:hypothetical protein